MKTSNLVTIGFSRPKNTIFPIGSWLIRFFQKTPYSHVYLKFYSTKLNREIIYEAVGHGVRFVGSTQWELYAQELESYEVEIQQCNYITLMQYCIDHAGLNYGYLQNIGIIIANFFNLQKNPFTSGKICSEIIADILRVEGYKIDIDSNLITPKDINDILRSKNGTL